MASTEKISVHSLADLKNTSDDAIPAYLNSLGFTQSHTLTDVRLGLGYTSFLICACTFGWDYKYGFDSTKYYTAASVALYALLSGLLTLWVWYEAGTIYIGTNATGEKIQIATKTTKHIPVYSVAITVWPVGEGGNPKVVTLKKPFTHWFDKEGHFVVKPFQEIFATNVEVIGKADPKRVVKKEEKVVPAAEANMTMDDKWASLLAESSGVSIEDLSGSAVGKGSVKGKKRSKKI